MIYYNEQVVIQKRTGKDIWKNLYELPLFESSEPIKNGESLAEIELWKQLIGSTKKHTIKLHHSHQQQLTHQKINGSFWMVNLQGAPKNHSSFNWVDIENLSKFAFPRIITLYLEDKSLNLG